MRLKLSIVILQKIIQEKKKDYINFLKKEDIDENGFLFLMKTFYILNHCNYEIYDSYKSEGDNRQQY